MGIARSDRSSQPHVSPLFEADSGARCDDFLDGLQYPPDAADQADFELVGITCWTSPHTVSSVPTTEVQATAGQELRDKLAHFGLQTPLSLGQIRTPHRRLIVDCVTSGEGVIELTAVTIVFPVARMHTEHPRQ